MIAVAGLLRAFRILIRTKDIRSGSVLNDFGNFHYKNDHLLYNPFCQLESVFLFFEKKLKHHFNCRFSCLCSVGAPAPRPGGPLGSEHALGQ